MTVLRRRESDSGRWTEAGFTDDDHFAHGNLRDCVAFTHSVAALCREHGRDRLDAEITYNTFAVRSRRVRTTPPVIHSVVDARDARHLS